MGRKPKKEKNQQSFESQEVTEQPIIIPIEVGRSWRIQTDDSEKTAKEFRFNTGHELQMDHISGNVYQVTIL